ncbi:hypothetical protein D3C80_2094500 [compost metagenome]
MITGITLSWNEKTWINTMPSQKVGTETNSEGSDCNADLSPPKPLKLERKAIASARINASEKPSTASCSVAGRLVANSSVTGTPA